MMRFDSPTATMIDRKNTPLNFISMDGDLPSSKPVTEQCMPSVAAKTGNTE